MRYTKRLETVLMNTELPLELEFTVFCQLEDVLAAVFATHTGKRSSFSLNECQQKATKQQRALHQTISNNLFEY